MIENGLKACALAVAVAGLITGAAHAEELAFTASLTGADEVPPVETTANGSLDATYDTESRQLNWTLEYSGLSGDATAAHFHGPAGPGENAGPVVTIEDTATGAEGSAELTEEQAAQLTDGQWYVNVHTGEYPDGEIRGQVTAQ
jgi:hypothetical protein